MLTTSHFIEDNMNKPAILGGKPVFDNLVPIIKPTLPRLHEIKNDINDILSSGMITNYKYVEQFEEKTAKYLGIKNIVAVSSGMSGLILVFKTLSLKGEVITPSFTFVATAHSLVWNNLTPIFVDCNSRTFNIDYSLIEERINSKTSAILPVHIFGNPCDINPIKRIAKDYNLKLIFDAAHALGSRYKKKKIGIFGDAEVFSLSPTKIATASEGGLVATDDDELAEKIRNGRDCGNYGDYDCRFVGLSARMPETNAILGIKSLEMLEKNISNRYKLANSYKRELRKFPGIKFQEIAYGSRTNYQCFAILVESKEFGLNRNQLAVALKKENIATKIMYFNPPVHKQIAYSPFSKIYSNKLPVTEHVSKNIICLPMYSHLPKETVKNICFAIERIYNYSSEVDRIIK